MKQNISRFTLFLFLRSLKLFNDETKVHLQAIGW